jgi:hypothetical protein
MIYIYSLSERVLDVWLIKQEVNKEVKTTGFFIIFNTNTTLINRPIDLSVLPVQILLPSVLSSVRHSPVFCMSFVYLSITKQFDKINNSIYTTIPLGTTASFTINSTRWIPKPPWLLFVYMIPSVVFGCSLKMRL